jgi:hypothetical protein
MTGIYIAIIVACVAIALTLAPILIWNANSNLTVTFYKEKSTKIEKAVKIVQLSDLHGKCFGKDNVHLLEKVKELSPDIIAFTGDIIHKYRKKDIKRAVSLVKKLIEIAPVYYVSGNHEMRVKHYGELRQLLSEAGAEVLDNKVAYICGIEVAGLNCAHLKNNSIFSLKRDDRLYRVLLAHKPEFLSNYARAGYDLVLSGHAHGGQWRVPFTDIGIYSPGQGLFPKLTSGEHTCASTHMVISRGLGNSQFPLRIFNHPEIVVINLISDESEK